MAAATKVADLKRRVRKIAADAPPGFAHAPTGFSGPGTGPGRRKSVPAEQPKDPKQQAILRAAEALDEHLQLVLTTTNMIEAPVKTTLNAVLQAAKQLGDPQMEQKAAQKFQRIFGEMLSAIEVIRTNLAPIVHETTAVRGEDKVLDSRGAKNLVDALGAALPVVRAAFKSIDPKSHESAVEQEIQKQGHFLTQIKKVMSSAGTENPQTQAKLQAAVRGAEFYLVNLQKLADPEFADRVQTNVDRSMTQHIPAAIQAAKALAKEFGATEKAASIQQIQKRLHTVAKRIVLLSYLRSKSL